MWIKWLDFVICLFNESVEVDDKIIMWYDFIYDILWRYGMIEE